MYLGIDQNKGGTKPGKSVSISSSFILQHLQNRLGRSMFPHPSAAFAGVFQRELPPTHRGVDICSPAADSSDSDLGPPDLGSIVYGSKESDRRPVENYKELANRGLIQRLKI